MLRIINYPHPTLRRTAKPLRRVDSELRGMIEEMLGLMYEHKGVGLAATQVNLPYRMFVVNESGEESRKDQEFVFINPVLSKPKGTDEDEEGCLSLPGLYAPVRRPESVTINAYDLQGNLIMMEASGRFARILQHETDHLDGKLFIDRLSPTQRIEARDRIEEFEIEFQQMRSKGDIPDDALIAAQMSQLEELRT